MKEGGRGGRQRKRERERERERIAVCVRVRVCLSACVRACVRACARARARVRARVDARAARAGGPAAVLPAPGGPGALLHPALHRPVEARDAGGRGGGWGGEALGRGAGAGAGGGGRGGVRRKCPDTSHTHAHTRPPPSPCVAYYIISYYIIQYYIIQYYVASRRAPYRACRPPALRPADGARAARRGRGRRAPDIFTARSAVLRQQVKMARSESVRVGPSRSKPRAARACRGRACAATVSVRAQREARLERPQADPPLLRSKNLSA